MVAVSIIVTGMVVVSTEEERRGAGTGRGTEVERTGVDTEPERMAGCRRMEADMVDMVEVDMVDMALVRMVGMVVDTAVRMAAGMAAVGMGADTAAMAPAEECMAEGCTVQLGRCRSIQTNQ